MAKSDKRPSFIQLKELLEQRFLANMHRHKGVEWREVLARLDDGKYATLQQMEDTGGEPDIVGMDKKLGHFIFMDCSPESPAERRSLCYDAEALDARKEAKPIGSAMSMAGKMGIELLDEEAYRYLQQFGPFDTKTSSWILTPTDIRKKGGALFGDYRYGRVFTYHNGAQSYYAARGFRGLLKI